MNATDKGRWGSPRLARATMLVGIVALTLLGYGLRLYGARSSINYIPDTQIIREALDLGQGLAGGRIFEMNLGAGFKYPLTLPYFLLGVYGLLFVGGYLSGSLPNIRAFIDFLFLQRETVHLISVAALNLINAAAIPLAFVAARRLDKRHGGWLAAGLVTFDLILVQWGHQARPHAPLATFMLLAVMLLAAIAEGRGRWLASLAATGACVLAIGTLQNGIAVTVPFGLVWLARLWGARQKGRLADELKLLAVNLILLLGLSVLVYPSLISEYSGLVRALIQSSRTYSLGAGAHTLRANNFNWENPPRFIVRFFGYQPLPFILMPIGLAYFLWQMRSRPRLLLAVLPVPICSLLVWFFYFTASRYWTDLSLFNDLLCAYFIEEMVRLAAARWQWPSWKLAAGVFGVVIAVAAVEALRFDYVTAQPDTRTLASQWVEENLPTGSVVVGNFQLLELLPTQASLRQQGQDYPDSLGTYGQWLLQQKASTYPTGKAFEIVDYSLYWPETEAEAVSLVQHRQIEYALVQTTASGFSNDYRLMNFATKYGQPVAVFCPSQRWGPTYLPTDIFAPAWQVIWNANRPGPIVMIFKLGEEPQSNIAALTCP
jgi:Dolichyl-phosphate-mannose-protein mannosyltransferase